MAELINTASMDFETLQSMEWLETNGLGGYASSTIANCNSRKYHGLLVCQIPGLPDRQTLLSTLEESLLTDESEEFFSVHRFPGVIHPKGHLLLKEFSREPLPSFTYHIKKIILKKQCMLLQGEDTLLIKYSLIRNPGEAALKIQPLLAFRNFHQLSRVNGRVRTDAERRNSQLSFAPYEGMPSLFLAVSHPYEYRHNPDWYRNFVYDEEKHRGFEDSEDLLRPGALEIRFRGNAEIIAAFSTKPLDRRLDKIWGWAFEERLITEKALPSEEPERSLSRSARQFVVRRAKGKKTIIAGYHWFLDWGRDAMIALPGLMMNRPADDYLSVLDTFAEKEKNGLIPNFISETTNDAAYNTVDASLWFGWAVQQYLHKTQDYPGILKTAWPALKNIFYWYNRGTDFNIKMHENGLIYAGDSKTQLTWMDAQVHGIPVTPRYGFAVEINALWYNFLNFIMEFARKTGDELPLSDGLIAKIRKEFNNLFWDDKNGCLADFVNENGPDFSMRPNQIFAVSLPHTMLDLKRSRAVMDRVKKELLTPFGLRTLSPADPRYCPRYSGNADTRDFAYHNGTVWPWLLGHYGEALLKTARNKTETRQSLQTHLAATCRHLLNSGLGTISEVFDGSDPHSPGGCISQAWSVGELLRLKALIQN